MSAFLRENLSFKKYGHNFDKAVLLRIGVIALVIACMIGTNIIIDMKNARSLTAQINTIDEIQAQLSMVSATNHDIRRTAVKMTTGVDVARVANDALVAEKFISQVTTWSTYEQYDKLRQMCINDYGLTEDSDFMQTYMPFILNTELNGNYYNHIDTNGLNAVYKNIHPYVVGVDKDSYSYVAVVNWCTQTGQSQIGYATSIFSYTINKEGKMSDISAYTLQS